MLPDPADPRRPSPAPRRGDAAAAAALVARVARGDLRAFEALYRNYHPRLARFIGQMAPRRTLVEEVLNDTMLVVWKRGDRYNGQSKVSTWIFAIAYRTTLKALRQQDEPVDEPDEEPPSDARSPEQQHSDGQTRAALSRALAQLSAEHRTVLVLTYFHDLAQAEIAQIVECPAETVKTRVFHARRRLRALLSGEAGDWL